LALAALLASVSAPVSADVVELKSGWKTEGTVTETEELVTVELKSGQKVSYPRGDVVRIVRQDTPGETFEKRYKEVDRKNLAALEDLAGWCRVNGLGPEAVRVAQDMLAVDADNEFAKNILIRYKMVVEHIPPNRERDADLVREYGSGFRIYLSRHYRICYNTDPDYSKERARFFETLYEQFYRHFDKMGMPMKFLEDRVEVVLFKSREDYAAYAATKYPTLARSAGFYSQIENRAVFFDGKGDGFYGAFRKKYESYTRSLQNLRNRMAGLRSGDRVVLQFDGGRSETHTRNSLMDRISQMEKEARDQWRKFEDERQSANLATTMHECAHQLSFTLGVLPTEGAIPKLVAEGIATYFEETEPDRKARADGINERLLKVYHSRPKRGLRDLLTDEMVWVRFDDNTEVAYAQGWALFFFLSACRQEQLVAYLKCLNDKALEPDTPERRVADFERAFGPLSRVEQEWRAHMAGVKAN